MEVSGSPGEQLIELYIDATSMIDALSEQRHTWARRRAFAVAKLQELGWSLQQIADAVDRSKNSIAKTALDERGINVPRFLVQHLDLSASENGGNWVAHHETLNDAMTAADRVYDVGNLLIRQEIIDGETGVWAFRGAGSTEWSWTTRRQPQT